MSRSQLLCRVASRNVGVAIAGMATLTLGAAKVAQAQITYYTDPTAFAAAAGALTTFNFNGYAPVNSSTQYSNGLTVNGINFGSGYAEDPGSGFGNPFSGEQYYTSSPSTSLQPTFPSTLRVFGADFSNYGSLSVTQFSLLTFVSGQPQAVRFFNVPADTSSTFFGFIATGPVTAVSITGSGSQSVPAIDNVRIASASSGTAPEPGSIALLVLSGLPVVRAVTRRRRKVA